MRENENPCETLKCLRAGFLFFIYLFIFIYNFLILFMGRAGLNMGILFLG